MDVMNSFVRNFLKTNFNSLPDETVVSAKRAILDTIGVMIAGSSDRGCQLLVEAIREWGGPAEATIAIFGEKVPANLAALTNGTMARALEIADVYDGFPLHPSSSIVPVALSLAERQGGITGKDLIRAVAIGHDMLIRMALATKVGPIQSGRYNLFKIFPPTGVAGFLLGLDEEQMSNAMGIAFTQMVADGQSALDGAMTHYLQQGIVAQSAIESALLAQKGITGGRNILQGRYGLYNSYEPDPNLEELTRDLGKVFLGGEISIKLYSSCRATHEAIDLALDILENEKIIPDQIEQITVKVNEPVFNLTCLNRKPNPQTSVEAQFSLPYCVAAALIKGDVFVDELSEKTIKDPAITALAERVRPIIDNDCQTELVVGSTVMEIKLADGRKFSNRTNYPRGNPKNPLSLDHCLSKFTKSVSFSLRPLPEENINKIKSLLVELEGISDVGQIPRLLIHEC